MITSPSFVVQKFSRYLEIYANDVAINISLSSISKNAFYICLHIQSNRPAEQKKTMMSLERQIVIESR